MNAQHQNPSQILPPTQPVYRTAITRRGRPYKGARDADRQRGKPFTITRDSVTGDVTLTFGNVGSFVRTDIDLLTFQKIANSPNPLRTFNLIYPHPKG
jgi:hypothetical protein